MRRSSSSIHMGCDAHVQPQTARISAVAKFDHRFGHDLSPEGFLRLESPVTKKRKPVSLPSVSILKG